MCLLYLLNVLHEKLCTKPGLWTRIHFLLLNADPDQAFKKLPYEEFSEVEKDKKGRSKVKNPRAGPNLDKFCKLNYKKYRTNFLAFNQFFPLSWIRIQYADPEPQPFKKQNTQTPTGT